MSRHAEPESGRKSGSFCFVALLLLASLTGLVSLPGASANAQGDLSLQATISPVEDSWRSSWETVFFSATIENQGLQQSVNRALWWYVCEGDVASSLCISTYDERGSFSLATIYPDVIADYQSPNSWNPSGDEGVYTVVFAFELQDQDPTDDMLSFKINLTQSFVDLATNQQFNPTSTLENLAYEGSQSILNSNTDYSMEIRGSVTACGTCNFVAELGWQLWTEDGTTKLSESYTNVSNLPSWGGSSAFTRDMPVFNHPNEGTFILKWGLFNSSGTPYADLNPANDYTENALVINNSIDLAATSMNPSHQSNSAEYYYGQEMMHSVITNEGYVSISNTMVSFLIYNPDGMVEDEQLCPLSNIHPGESRTCKFNITIIGDDRTLILSISTNFIEGFDSKTGNNNLNEVADIIAGNISARIDQSNPLGTYTTGEYIEMVARTGSTAAGPLNYSWWVSGIVNLGYGQVLNISGSLLGLGDHTITLRVTDVFGQLDSVHKDISLFNYISLDNEPFFTGQAVTQSPSYLNHESILPVLGTQYGIGEGREPLLLLSFEILSSEDNSNITGLERIDIHLNTSALLPQNIPLESVDIRYLPSLDDNIWTFISEYTKNADHSFDVTLYQTGVILVIGEVPAANISSGQLVQTQLEGGILQLDWEPSGDIQNPYIGSWNIYKLTVTNGAGTVFPEPYLDFNEYIWEQLTASTLVTSVNLDTDSWTDPSPLPTNVCASYAIMPADREGQPDFLHIEISRDESGQSTAFCGDAIAPEKTVSNMQISSSFTNDTECYKIENDWNMCYDVNMTWTWPSHETDGNVTWNLYRTDQKPLAIDLTFLTPLETGLTGEEGTMGYYNQSGEDDANIRPYRTFYYILAPVDSVGNQFNQANYPTNSIRITIVDEWWNFNQHLIPEPAPEPEPPLGVEWLGTLSDYMEVEEFQTTGMISLITLVLSMIALPLLVKRRKRLARVMKARKNRGSSQLSAADFEDFFD